MSQMPTPDSEPNSPIENSERAMLIEGDVSHSNQITGDGNVVGRSNILGDGNIQGDEQLDCLYSKTRA